LKHYNVDVWQRNTTGAVWEVQTSRKPLVRILEELVRKEGARMKKQQMQGPGGEREQAVPS
jgi:hypothetical protein